MSKDNKAAVGLSHANCFACGPLNVRGLRLQFRTAGKHAVSKQVVLSEEYQGYPGIIQGGIVSTLLDSVMTNCLFLNEIEAMTVRLNVRFREPVLVNRAMTLLARIVRQRGRFYELEASIMQDGRRKAAAEGRFLCNNDSRAESGR